MQSVEWLMKSVNKMEYIDRCNKPERKVADSGNIG